MAGDRLTTLKANPFLDGPGEFLAKQVAAGIAAVEQFHALFGNSIDAYERTDYSFRELPAIRIYNHGFHKETESHYITGTLTMDVLFPANLRREETQTIQAQVSTALLQQFRRPSFFDAMRDVVPGLNELGKTFDIDMTLGMQWSEGILPLTQIMANFRLDLKEWDEYLEIQNRTKDDPFQESLMNLETLRLHLEAVKDSAEAL